MTHLDAAEASRTADPARPRTARRLTQVSLILVCLLAVALNVVGSQLHHHYAPTESGGWRELPTYAVTGLLSYGLVSIGLLVVRRRPAATATVALVYGVLGIAAFYVTYWTAWPAAASVSALLLARDAGRGTRSTVAIVLAGLTFLAIIAMLVYRGLGGLYQTGS